MKMTNGREDNKACSKYKRYQKKSKQNDLDVKPPLLRGKRLRLSNGYEAARRKRFNETVELLRLELELEQCPKVKIVESATDYIKNCKLLQQCILHDKDEETEGIPQTDEDENGVNHVNMNLRRKIGFYKHLLKEANINIEFKTESKHICVTFPVLQKAEENVFLKTKTNKYDLCLNMISYQASESIISKNATSQCEKKYFDYLAANDELLEDVDGSKNVSNVPNIDEFTDTCISNGQIVVGGVKNGMLTVWLPSEEPASHKSMNVITGVVNIPGASCDNQTSSLSNLGSVSSVRGTSKPACNVSPEGENIKFPSASTGEDDVAATCPSRVLILPTQRNLQPPHITLVTPSPSQRPIMSTGRNGTFLKGANQNSLILLPGILPPCKRLKKIAPKPHLEDKPDDSPEKVATDPSLLEGATKRKCLWKDKTLSKSSKVMHKAKEQICDSDRQNFDNDNTLQDISASTLNSIVRNAAMIDVDGEDQPLQNLINFPCIGNPQPNIEPDNNMDADENIVEMLCSIADNNTSTSDVSPSFAKNNPQLSSNPQMSSDSLTKNRVEGSPDIADANDKNAEVSQVFCENTTLDPSVAKSNYSVMSLCMPSKIDKCNSAILPQADVNIEISSLETFKKVSNADEISLIDSVTTIGPAPDSSFTPSESVVNVTADVASTNRSLPIGSRSHAFPHPFPSIPIPPIGLPVFTTIPHVSEKVSHSISRISCSTANLGADTSKKVKPPTTTFAEQKLNDSVTYNTSSTLNSLSQTTPSISLSAVASTVVSTPSTCIGSSLFTLPTIPSYSRPFGFCSLSISEAPTTFSFTLTTQSSALSTSINISAPISSDSVINTASRVINDKLETATAPCSSAAVSEAKTTEETSPLAKLTNVQVGYTHSDCTSTNDTLFNPLHQAVTCGQAHVSNSTCENSMNAPLFVTPLKTDTSLPVSADAVQCVTVTSDSITYSCCSSAPMSPVFSSSVSSSVSIPLTVTSSGKPRPQANILIKADKISGSKKKMDLPVDKQSDGSTKKILIEEKILDSTLTCNESDSPTKFRMPLLPLSSYTSSISKTTHDLAADAFPLVLSEHEQIDTSFLTDGHKKDFCDSISSPFAASSTLSELSSYVPITLKSKDSLFRDSIVQHFAHISDKDKHCDLSEVAQDKITTLGSRTEPEHAKQFSLQDNSESRSTADNKLPNNSSRNDKIVSTLYQNDQLSQTVTNSEPKKLSLSLIESHDEPLTKEIGFDEGRLLDPPSKPGEGSKPISSNPAIYSSDKSAIEACLYTEKETTDTNMSCSNPPLASKDVPFSTPKCGFGPETEILIGTPPTVSSMIGSKKENCAEHDNERRNDKTERLIDASFAKKYLEAKSVPSAKPTEPFVAPTVNDVIHGTPPNTQLKSCDATLQLQLVPTAASHEQPVSSSNSRRNTEAAAICQKVVGSKVQSNMQGPPFSNVCISQTVSLNSTQSAGSASHKHQQTPEHILSCGSDSKRSTISSHNSIPPQFEQQPLHHQPFSHHQNQLQQNVPSLSQQQPPILHNNQTTDIFPFYSGTDRDTVKGPAANNMSSMMPGCSYVQSFDYNSYYRKPTNFTRLDSRYNAHGYKQFSQNNNEFLPEAVILPNQPPAFPDGTDDLSLRGVEISASDHVRGFSVSHLVSQASDARKTVQKDHGTDDKAKDGAKAKSASKKSEGKGRCSTATKAASISNDSRQRGQGRNAASFPPCFNSKPQQRNIATYSTEALLSSQNYHRPNHRQSINQNYHLMPPNQVYQPSYSSQPVKNLPQNAPFSYGTHERSASSMHCNPDYNFQLHPQASSTLTPYGSNMPYMAPSYPYQNIAPSSSSMISGDIMGTHHAGTYRLPDISDQSNFHSNTSFTLPIEGQDVCTGNVIGSGQSARMSVTEPTFGISSTASMHYRSSASKTAGNQQHSSVSLPKRSKYFDPGMIASGVSTPTNFLDGGSLTHIPIHSFTPPCEDSSALVHTNLLGGASRHQNNFLIGHDSIVPLNGGGQYQDANAITANLTNQHLQMPPVSKGVAMPQIFPSNPALRTDRQINTASSHLSSSLSNFNVTSIIEIDAKQDESSSAMTSGSSRQISTMGDSISMAAYNRIPSMGTNFAPVSNTNKDAVAQVDGGNHRFAPVNSMNNIFGHSHQVGLNLNSGLLIPTSTFSGMSFQPGDH